MFDDSCHCGRCNGDGPDDDSQLGRELRAERYADLCWEAAHCYFTTLERDPGFVNFLAAARLRLQRRLDGFRKLVLEDR